MAAQHLSANQHFINLSATDSLRPVLEFKLLMSADFTSISANSSEMKVAEMQRSRICSFEIQDQYLAVAAYPKKVVHRYANAQI